MFTTATFFGHQGGCCGEVQPIILHKKFLQFDWLRAVVFQINSKYLHVKIITNVAGSSINK